MHVVSRNCPQFRLMIFPTKLGLPSESLEIPPKHITKGRGLCIGRGGVSFLLGVWVFPPRVLVPWGQAFLAVHPELRQQVQMGLSAGPAFAGNTGYVPFKAMVWPSSPQTENPPKLWKNGLFSGAPALCLSIGRISLAFKLWFVIRFSLNPSESTNPAYLLSNHTPILTTLGWFILGCINSFLFDVGG